MRRGKRKEKGRNRYASSQDEKGVQCKEGFHPVAPMCMCACTTHAPVGAELDVELHQLAVHADQLDWQRLADELLFNLHLID